VQRPPAQPVLISIASWPDFSCFDCRFLQRLAQLAVNEQRKCRKAHDMAVETTLVYRQTFLVELPPRTTST
jgi:hypothetical protein